MGLLDDAIREHLDLKRRRGGDPEEIERAEHEALGPVRRGPDEADELVPELEASDAYEETPYAESEDYEEPERYEGGLAYDHEEDLRWQRDDAYTEEDRRTPAAEELVDPPSFVGSAPDAEPSLPEEQEPPGPVTEAAPPGGEPIAPVPAPGPEPEPVEPEPPAQASQRPPEPRRPADITSDETAEYDVEQELDRAGKEDVLEETPEFLQDTPDHDRLWFEQRPPRDFDFDG